MSIAGDWDEGAAGLHVKRPAWPANDGAVSFDGQIMTGSGILASANVDVIGPRCPAHCGQQG
jgi:hypothetical protein